ncbi:MAG: tRNA1(Val) (adenine(37)-N6)-methyltransferase [Nitrospirota bacterium]|nr:tRNA1(Val) (adenine(37)-N6)-methyltransferase [Nitrospirota bacterium]
MFDSMETSLDGIRDVKVYQNVNGYRFSVDAVLLYSFVNVKYACHIADLGTGSGIIGLLLARKYGDARVLLVELQESLYALAEKNIVLNGLEERVKVVLSDIKELKEKAQPLSHDLVVSNPPFRKPSSGRISNGEEKAVARHELRLNLSDLTETVSYLLRPKGRFCMIFHPERLAEAIDTLRRNRLEPKRIRFVHNDHDAVSKIVLIEAVKEGRAGIRLEKPLFIYDKEGEYTAEVNEMYGRKQPEIKPLDL